MGDVVRLIDVAAGFSPADSAEMKNWLHEWADYALKDGAIRSLVVIFESSSGEITAIRQSLGPLTKAQTVGMLELAKVNLLDGNLPHPK